MHTTNVTSQCSMLVSYELDCDCRSCFVEFKSLLFSYWDTSPYTLQVVQVNVAIGNSLLLFRTCYNFTPALEDNTSTVTVMAVLQHNTVKQKDSMRMIVLV